jgi:hypothetical protein
VTWPRAILRQVVALFVDDRGLAACIVAWLLAVRLLARLHMAPGWSAMLLFAGCATILAESTLRRARK